MSEKPKETSRKLIDAGFGRTLKQEPEQAAAAPGQDDDTSPAEQQAEETE